MVGRTAATIRRLGVLLAITAPIAAGLVATIRPATAARPIGDRLGIAFFATMHRAYLHTPGVEMTVVSRGSNHTIFGYFRLRLDAATVVAEEFAGAGGDPNRLVARRGGPTYAWRAGENCWRPVPRSDPRRLTDVGLPYPYSRSAAKTMAPQPQGSDLILATENPDKVWFLATQNAYGRSAKRIVTYSVDARTHRIRSIAIRALKGGSRDVRPHVHPQSHWWTAKVRDTPLTSPPHLPAPVPAC
jgi:hypothetical protein